MSFRSAHEFSRLTTVFRTWRSTRDASLHAHHLTFTVAFEASELDDSRSVLRLSQTAPLDAEIRRWYAGTFIIAKDDPDAHWFDAAHARGVLRVALMDHVGGMAFARHVCNLAVDFLRINGLEWRLKVAHVTCALAGAESCTYTPPTPAN